MARSSAQTKQLVVLGLASAVAVSLLVWKLSQRKPASGKKLDDDDDDDTLPTQASTASRGIVTPNKKKTAASKKSAADAETPKRTNKTLSNADVNTTIEELDKKGKAFFKNKQVRDRPVNNSKGYSLTSHRHRQLPAARERFTGCMLRFLILILHCYPFHSILYLFLTISVHASRSIFHRSSGIYRE